MNTSFNPAKTILESESFLSGIKDSISAFFRLSPDKVSLSYYQYFQLAAAAYSWKPDLIIELGRAYGNSTFAFTEAMNQTGGKVISLCNKDDWQQMILPKIKHLINDKWQERLDARTVNNFVEVDLTQEINAHKRIMIFWDAHGFQTAEYVLGHLLPLMKNKECVVLMHDITDMRFHSNDHAYQGQRLWRSETANEGSVKVRLNNFISSSEQLISVLDFCDRNKLALKSADESLRNELTTQQAQQLKTSLCDAFSLDAHWVFFQLPDDVSFEKLTFPAFDRQLILSENKFKDSYLLAYHNSSAKTTFTSFRLRFIQSVKQLLRSLFLG